MPYIKALDLPVSEMKNFEVGLLWSYVPTCASGTGPVLNPGATLIEAYKEMQHTKYQSSRPSSFRKEEL